MNLANETQKQHFLSQVEQRMNAFAGEDIYEFLIIRSDNDVRLEAPKLKSIKANLKWEDLFTFDRGPKAKIRENFEYLFHEYENTIFSLTQRVIEKASAKSEGLASDLIELFTAKLMNFVRNPFCVEKMLNTFAPVKDAQPVDADLKQLYDKVLAGQKPQQKHLCRKFGISDAMYQQWLATLFMLLADFQRGQPNFLRQTIDRLFASVDTVASAMICLYSSKGVLLSDRAMTSVFDDDSSRFDYNLCSTAFVRYEFFSKAAILGKHASSNSLMQRGIEKMLQQKTPLHVLVGQDNFDQLKAYNANVIEQSCMHVYCASDSVQY